MSRLRNDDITQQTHNTGTTFEKTEFYNGLSTNLGSSEWRQPSSGSSYYGSSSQQNHSVISDMTQSEFSCYVALSEDEDAGRKHNSKHVERSLSPLSATAVATSQLLSTTPRKSKGFPPKPPVSLHRPPSVQSLNNSQNIENSPSFETDLSQNNRSFVTTGSGFSGASSSNNSGVGATKNPHQPILSKRDSSSSLTSAHRRAVPMHYDDSYHVLFVERNRLDSEVSALGMGSGLEDEENSHKQPTAVRKNDSSDDEDSMDKSPFPLLQHKGEGRPPHQTKGGASKRERKPLQALPPPPPPPLMTKPGLGRNRTEKETRNLRRNWRGVSAQEMTNRKPQLESSHQMKFLSKCAILEEHILASQKRVGEANQRVVVSGWIVILFEKVVDGDKMSHSTVSTSSSSTSVRASLSPGFGAEDLYYMCIVENSHTAASLILYRSTDGSEEYVFPIEADWVVQSRESEDRRVGRSISIWFGEGRNGFGSLCMVPVALQDRWRTMLDHNLRKRIGKTSTVKSTHRDTDHLPTEQIFLLPPPGRYASGKQLDVARHVFFTIDSFVKRYR